MIKKLSKEQMLDVQGGITRAEYCSQLRTLIIHNAERWDYQNRLNAAYAWEANCN